MPRVECLEERVALAVIAPVDSVLNGYSPAVAGSSGSLRIRLSGNSAQVQWGSTDSYLGIMDTSVLTPTTESVTTGPGGVPNHLIFIAVQNGVTFNGNITLSATDDQGTLNIISAGRRVSYVLDQNYLLASATPSDAGLEIFAKSFAYDETLSVGEQVVGFDYFVNTIFDDPTTGFQAYGLTSPDAPPILAIRGTAGLSDLISDANPNGVGYNQFVANVGPVDQWLASEQKQTGLAPIITGHSLGGALTQWIATAYTSASPKDLLSEVVTFNAPGISSAYAANFVPGQVLGYVHHYIDSGDVVSMAGQAFIAGQWIEAVSTFPTLLQQLNPLYKHTYPMLAASIEGNVKPSVTLTTYANVSWLNSPLFLYSTPDYYAFLTAMGTIPALQPLALSLIFRSTTESARSSAGAAIYATGIPTLVQDINQIVAQAQATGKIAATLPSVQIGFGGVMLFQATNMQVVYDINASQLEIQGQATLPALFNATVDLTGNNYIGISATGIALVGTVTVPDVTIVPGWDLQNLQLSLDTTTGTVNASGSMAFGPSVNFSVPLLGYSYSGNVINATFSGTITPQALTSTGSMTLLGGLASIPSATLGINFVNDTLSGSGQASFLSDAVNAALSFAANTSFVLTASGSASVTVPSAISVIGGISLGSGSFTLYYNPSLPVGQDYLSLSGTLPVVGTTVGFTVYLDGSISVP